MSNDYQSSLTKHTKNVWILLINELTMTPGNSIFIASNTAKRKTFIHLNFYTDFEPKTIYKEKKSAKSKLHKHIFSFIYINYDSQYFMKWIIQPFFTHLQSTTTVQIIMIDMTSIDNASIDTCTYKCICAHKQ